MTETSGRRQLWVRLATILGIWLIVGVVLTGQSALVIYSARRAYEDLPQQAPRATTTELFLLNIAESVIWAGLTVGILWLGARFPLAQRRWWKSLAVHVPASLATAVLQTVLAVVVNDIVRQDLPRPTLTANVLFLYFVAKIHSNVFLYWAILAASQIINHYRQARARELRESQLEAKLAQTQLQLLKMQLHPHFLFNTLNAISALIHQDVELADRMIARLGDLLRITLENASTQEVPLKQELDWIQPYLDIEKARLGPRLTVHFEIDPAVMDARVPNLILQPLVENAIRHGVAPRPEPGRIAIAAGRDNGKLRLAVSDDGPGLQSPEAPRAGIGLANTRARLEKLYGAEQRLELSNGPERGLRVAITIPFHEAAPLRPSEPNGSHS
ncbi:MAG: histidine kinase [Gemmataceae bacterium]|nr:histidine kinase [Gemmataceae bacterium]